jgi:hypothetical protein
MADSFAAGAFLVVVGGVQNMTAISRAALWSCIKVL